MYAKCRIALHVSVCIVMILSFDAGYAWAQVESAVRGQVVAAADGSVLAEAAVTLTSVAAGGESVQTRTEASGRFTFPNVRPGEYILSVSSVLIAVWIVIGGVASASVPEVMRQLHPIFISQVFLFLCVLAETIKYLTQGICYRRGS